MGPLRLLGEFLVEEGVGGVPYSLSVYAYASMGAPAGGGGAFPGQALCYGARWRSAPLRVAEPLRSGGAVLRCSLQVDVAWVQSPRRLYAPVFLMAL